MDHIAAEGGRVVSVNLATGSAMTLEPVLPPYEVASGYVFVSEYELPRQRAVELHAENEHLGS